MNKSFLCVIWVAFLVSCLTLTCTTNSWIVRASTDVSGIITSDSKWTKAGSPYSLVGNLLVSNGATLTIEAGVTVNLNGFYMLVNGTLRAEGTETDKVQFNNGTFTLTQYCNGWDEQAGSGCIFENANLNFTSISSAVSLKLNKVYSNATISIDSFALISYSSLTSQITVGDSSILSHNFFNNGQTKVGDSSTVTGNTITGYFYAGNQSTITNNNITERIKCGSASIVNNRITGALVIRNPGSAVSEIRNNSIIGGGAVWYYGLAPFPRYPIYPQSSIDVAGGQVEISDNSIANLYSGEEVPDSQFEGGCGITTQADCVAVIQGNKISGGFEMCINVVGPATIQGNVMSNNSAGIAVGKTVYDYGMLISEGDVTITDNVFVNNVVGIRGNVINSYYGQVDYSATSKIRIISIVRNLIAGSQKGIDVFLRNATLCIQNNTITDCSDAITLNSCPSAIINFNNIQNCTQKSINLVDTAVTIDATNNWWGTTDTSAINQTIYDYKNDFYLGKVRFTPILSEPNPNAEPKYVSMIPEFSSWLLLLLFLLISSPVVVFRKNFGGRFR